ncbi:MAG: queuosine precursor transporter, partial [Bacteroidota bacterium]
FGLFTQSLGIILWPIVFFLPDLINEHYGVKGVRKLTYITVGLISYTFILISIGIHIPAVGFSPVNDATFNAVFGQSQWIIVGSIVAFFFSQLIDVYVFWIFRNKTKGKYIWLRATGSTVVSQLIDTFVVQFIAFVIPGKWAFSEFIKNATWGYGFKLLVALCLIPFIYLGHYAINKLLRTNHNQQITE